MAAYRYPLPRAYRRVRRYPYRFRSRKNSGGALPIVIAGVVLAAGAGTGVKAVTRHHAAPAAHAPAPADGNAAAARVIAFARAQLGKPYLWGGTGPDAFDCSGLAMQAYASAGISIERTSQQQWASEKHVPAGKVVAGDLVFFAGSDGTPTAPGHVGLVVGKNLMIEAYATGFPVRVSAFGTAQSAPGDGAVVGFTDPDPAPAPAPVPSAPQSGGSAVAAGRRMAASYGWTGTQWTCLNELWTHESNWDPYAANPTSTARGIPQDINGWSDFAPGDVTAQVAWGLAYIRRRYVTPCAAWKFETSHTPNWY